MAAQARPPVNRQATDEAREILEVLNEVSGRRVLSGQHL